jgi:DNA-binding beta-propeller fold protein YncE
MRNYLPRELTIIVALCLLGAGLVLATPAIATPPPPPLPVLTNVGTATAGKYPLGVAINSTTARVLVANRDSKTASLVDLMTGNELWEVKVGRGPTGAAVNPTTNVGVVTLTEEKAVALLNLATGDIIRKIRLSGRPQGVAIDAAFNVAIVAVQPDVVAIIDLASMTVLSQPLIGKRPVGVAVNPLTHIAAVTNEKDGTVVLIDYTFPALPTVVDTIALPHSKNPKDPDKGPRAQPRGVAFDYGPSTNRLAVADPGSGLLVIVTLDPSNHAVGFATIDPTPNKPDKAVAVAVNPGFDYGVVTTGGDNGTGSTVYAFKLSQPALLGMVPRSKGEPKKPGGVAIDPVTCRAVVTAESIDGVSKANLLLLQTPCAPVITQLTPSAAQAATTFLLKVAGTGFNVTQTTLNFGDVTGIPMTQFAPGVMSAIVTAPATVGSINVSVTSNGKTSNTLPFQVTLLAPPVLCSVTPPTSVADQNPLPLQISASNVTTTGATVSFGGQPITLNSITPVVPPTTDATGCVTSQTVSATVPGYPTTTLTTHATLPSPQVQIKNSDGGSSNLLTVVISNPVPFLSELVPSAAAVGSSDLTILIFGDNFVYDVVDGDIVMLSQVRFNGTPLVQVLPYGPSPRTQMQVVVPAELMQAVQTYVVDVFNPGPGGGAPAQTQLFQVTSNVPPPGITVTTVPILPESQTPTTVALLTGFTPLTGIAAISDAGHLRSIDMTTAQLLASPVVPVAGPGAIGYLRTLPGGKAVITTLIDSDQLAVIDYSAGSPVVTMVDLNALAGSPCPAPCLFPSAAAVDAVDAVSGKVVVTNYGTATLQVLNVTNSGSGWTVTSAGLPIPVPGLVAPVGVAVDTNSGVAVIIDSPDPDPGVAWRIGYKLPATYGAVSAPVQLSSTGPSGIAVNSTTHEAVVGVTGDNTIQVVNLTAGTIRATLPAGVNPSGVAVDPVSNRALVTNINNNEITGINLNPAVPSVTRFQLSFAAQNPSDIAWDPASGLALAGTLIGQTNYAIVIGGLTPSILP